MHDNEPAGGMRAPAGTEPVWFVEATYAPDAAETRIPFRAAHIAAVARRIAEGVYVVAGGSLDVSASMVVVRADSEAEALELVGDDIYLRNGVWVELRARKFGRGVTPRVVRP